MTEYLIALVLAFLYTAVKVIAIELVPRYFRHHAVNACLAPVVSVHGQAVTTVEGIGSTKTRLHPVQV